MKRDNTSEKAKLWLKEQTQPYRAFILLVTFFTVLSTALSVIFAYMVRYLINSASVGNAKLLAAFSAVLVSLLFFRIAFKAFTGYLSEKLRSKMLIELKSKTFSKILRSDYGRLQSYHSGELLNRLTTDLQDIAGYSVGILPAVMGMIVQCIGCISALMTIDPIFTAVYVVGGCLFGGVTALFRKKIKKAQKEVLEADGKLRSFMQEGLGSTMTIKAYNAEEITTRKADRFANAYYQKRMKRNLLNSVMNFVFSMLSNFGLILAVVWCGISVLNGNDDYGSILSIILLLMQLQQPFASFSSIMPAYYARLASGERLLQLQEIETEEVSMDLESCKEIYNKLEKIRFENIDFSYDRDIVLKGATAEIEKGKIICLVGGSGSGKSTLFKLLLNVFTPQAGEIILQGDFEEEYLLTAKERGLFAYVPQGNFLFSGTIYENLTFFANEKNKEKLNDAVEKAIEVACAQFVWDLPQGLQTPLLEDGEGLSEGQLQRLAVARAIVSDRPILLLDEATSALDGETEKALLENIGKLQGKTCLIVTHRPAALAIADGVLSMEDGQIKILGE